MRLFVAIDVDEQIREKITNVMNEIMDMNVDVKFTRPENLHFTLKFLGEVNENGVNKIIEDIASAIKGFNPFNCTVEGMGYFGKPDNIRTIWIDTSEGHEELVKMAKVLNNRLNFIRNESREPKPHITIGRVKSGRDKEKLIKKLKELEHVKLGDMDVKFVKLKRSVLSMEGPTYSDVKTFELNSNSDKNE